MYARQRKTPQESAAVFNWKNAWEKKGNGLSVTKTTGQEHSYASSGIIFKRRRASPP